MQRLLKVMLIVLLFAGCSKPDVQEENVLKENAIYSAPITQNELTINLYNKVSEDLENTVSEEELVEDIARIFAADFYSFKGKVEGQVGGTTYILQEKRVAAKEYLEFYYYKNLPSILNQYGEDSLPEVKELVSASPIKTEYEEKDYGKLEAYDVRLDIAYQETQIPLSSLKTETVITLAKYPDGNYYLVEIK